MCSLLLFGKPFGGVLWPGLRQPGAAFDRRTGTRPDRNEGGWWRGLSAVAFAQGESPSGVETPARVWPVDLLIRNGDESAFLGNDIYSLDGTNQMREQWVKPGAMAVYIVQAQNDGIKPDAINLQATPAQPGWTVRYKDEANGNNITEAITSRAGWNTPPLAPEGAQFVRIEVVPDANSQNSLSLPLSVVATSTGDRQIVDMVLAMTITRTPPPQADKPVDLMIRHGFESAFTGEQIYNADGNEQGKRLSLAHYHTTEFVVRIQNRNSTAGRFKIKAPALHPGWRVQYEDAAQGGTDITNDITDTGWLTPELDSQEYRDLRVEITPVMPRDDELGDVEDLATLEHKAWLLTATLPQTEQAGNDSKSVLDAVKIEAVIGAPQVDALIRTAAEAAKGTEYMGEGIYNTSGARQIKTLAPAGNAPAVFHVQFKNESSHPDRFLVLGMGTAGGYGVRYFDKLEGGTDITRRVTADGWVTPEVAGKGTYEIRFEVGNFTPVSSEATQSNATGVGADKFLTAIYDVHTYKGTEKERAERHFYMLLSAGEITALMRGANRGIAYVGPNDPATEAGFSLSQAVRRFQALVRATSLMDETVTDTVGGYIH